MKPRKGKSPIIESKKNTVKVQKKYLKSIATNEDLTKKDLRIFIFLLTILDDEEYIKIPQKYICAELYMDKSSVSKAINNLENNGIINRDVVLRDHLKFSSNINIYSQFDFFNWEE